MSERILDNPTLKNSKITHAEKLLGDALKLHIMSSKNVPWSFEWYIKLNPDFILCMSQEF